MKWIKKLLSLFIEKTTEGADFIYGFSYLFQNGWFNDKDWKERTIFFSFPLPINRYGKYIACGDMVVEGERWLSVIFRFTYMKIGEKRIYKPFFCTYWAQIGILK